MINTNNTINTINTNSSENEIKNESSYINHCWNAIYINREWYFVDTLLGSGGTNIIELKYPIFHEVTP